jgi:hypothetical protein
MDTSWQTSRTQPEQGSNMEFHDSDNSFQMALALMNLLTSEPNQAAGKTWTGCLYSANKQPKSICFCLYTIRSDHAWNGNKVSPRHTGNERMGGLDSARHQDPSSWSPTLCARGGCRCRLRRHRPGFDVPFPMRNGVNSTRVVANWSCTPLSVPCRR